jgi:hypothetical protein
VSIDWWGSLTLLVGIVPILLALTLGGQEYPWGSWQVIGAFALGAAGVVAFVLVERRAREPIIPFDLFQNRTYVIGNAAALLIAGVAFFGAIVFLPIYMVLVVGVSASAAGLTVMPLTLGLVVSSFLSGQIVSRVGKYKIILLIGIALVFVGYWTMLGLTPETTRAQVTWRMIILGFGIGPGLPLFTLAVQNAVNPHEIGAATGSSQFFRQIGSTVGIAIFGTILATTLAAQLPRYMPPEMQNLTTTFNMGQLESGNFKAVGDQIRTGMQDTYGKIERALAQNDPASSAELLANPQVPAELKDLLAKGGIAAQVRAGQDARYQGIATALTSGSRSALRDLLADPGLPAPLKDRLGRIPMSVLVSPSALAGELAGIRKSIDEQTPALVQQATQATLARIRTSLDELAARVAQQVTVALKKAFTVALIRVYFWGMFVVILGFIVTLFLPELALRKTVGHAPAAKEG